jgi:hypothetical protein
MKKSFLVSMFAAAFLAASAVFAADTATSTAKEVTLVGSGQCAKCSLGKTDECQNAIVVKENGKDEVYMLTANDVSEKFHKKICKAAKDIKVTGVVKEVDGKKEITASKIELVKG